MVKWKRGKKRNATWRTIWLRFMKDLGAYGSWKTQTSNRMRKVNKSIRMFWLECDCNFSRARDIVNDSLCWSSTEEGSAFWGTLDDTWAASVDIKDFAKEFDEKEFLSKLNVLSRRFKLKWKEHHGRQIPRNYGKEMFE